MVSRAHQPSRGASPAVFPEADFVQGGEKISFRKEIWVKTTAFESSSAEEGFSGRKMEAHLLVSLFPPAVGLRLHPGGM